MKPTRLALACLALALLASIGRSCGLAGKYKAEKAKYEAYRQAVQADQQASQARIVGLTNEISHATSEIGRLEKAVAAKASEVASLSSRLDELQQSEPSQPDLEGQPLVVSLRGQVATLAKMFSLATATIADKDKIILEWQAKWQAQSKISDEWKMAYDREHGLRVMAEGLVSHLEGSVKMSKLKGRAATIALAVAGGAIVYSLVK